jgi:hypothetical protein
MKKLVITLFAALSCFASGATINLGGAPASRLAVQTSGGSFITGANSFYITAGTYQVLPASFDTAISGLIPLRNLSNTVVSVGAAAPAVEGNPSLIGGSFVGVGPDTLSSAQIFFLIANNADYTLATEVAVLRASTQLFPNPVSGSGTIAVTSSLTGLVEVFGSVTDAPSGNDFVTLVAIPEPSTALLGLLGVAGLIRRRR